MATKVKEIAQGLHLQPCDPEHGGCCSMHRRTDRIYEDQLWARRHEGARPYPIP